MIRSSNFLENLKKNYTIVIVFLTLSVTILVTSSYNKYLAYEKENYKKIINNIYFKKTIEYFLDDLNPKYTDKTYNVQAGDSLEKILIRHSVKKDEIQLIQKKISKENTKVTLKIGQEINFTFENSINNQKKINSLIIPVSKTHKVHIKKNIETGILEVKNIVTNLSKKIKFKESRIINSLYKTAINLGVKPNLIVDFARIYGFQVDFQRDIRKNDRFQILYEIFENDKGEAIETGNIIFANLKLSGIDLPLYFYIDQKKKTGHYDDNGKSAKKALMKTPINGARLSSSFGLRKHPILGYNKMHRGTDFAAPTGTPIMASGDGVVIRARWCGGGGNCIKIKHNSTYSTVYAHLSKFAAGIKSKTKVKQGQIIGYVGSTGLSTGPHLHYEVIVNGKKVNSQKLNLPSGKILKGKERKKFEVQRIKTDVLLAETISKKN